ncbi:hypothetical protein KAR91_38175 [Candidatus Pacearchaeota archaeon]|nr:hypothetical protein [Candidatus Pacearchaeota archaeon]
MEAYQVVNNHGNTPDFGFGDLCVFPERRLADSFIDYLNECVAKDPGVTFTVKPITVYFNSYKEAA